MNDSASNGVGTDQSVAASSGNSAPTSGSADAVATPTASSPSPEQAKLATVERVKAAMNLDPETTAANEKAAPIAPKPQAKPVDPKVLEGLGIDATAFAALPAKVQEKLLAQPEDAGPDLSQLEEFAKAGTPEATPPTPNAAAQTPPATTQEQKTPPAAFGLDPQVLQQFAADYPELEGPILKPMSQMAQTLQQVTEHNQQMQSMLMGLADHITNQTAQSVLSSLDGADELYGKGEPNEAQSKLVNSVTDFALAIVNGSAKKGKPISFKEALKHAHTMKNSDWIKARAEKTGIAKAQQKQAVTTNRAATQPTQINAQPGDWKAAAAKRIQAVLAK